MADTTNVALDGTYKSVAAGEGNVTIEAKENGARWIIAASAPANTFLGYTLESGKPVSMALASGETLRVKGAGTLVVQDNTA